MATKDQNTPQPRRRTAPKKTAPGRGRSAASRPAQRRPETAQKRPARSGERSTAPKQPQPGPEVVYLPPKPFSRSRMILHLTTVVAVVLALLLGVSLFFKVDTVMVSGNVKYSAWDIQQASGIHSGDGLLTLSGARIAGKIRTALPYVSSVRIGIKLPNTVNIEIVEIDVTYAVQGPGNDWWLVSAEGKVVEKVADGAQAGHTRLLGVQLADPQVSEQAQALENAPAGTAPDGSQAPQVVSQAQRLQTALDIAGFLEQNSMIGSVVSIDVTDLGNIQLWHGTQYQVLLGDNTQLSYKIACLKGALEKMADYQSGVLDISLTTPDQVIYTPFT